jgi:hypothetical protein
MEYTGCSCTEERGLKARAPPDCHVVQIKGLVAAATLFIYFVFFSFIHLQSHSYSTFIHLFTEASLHFFIAK